MRACSIPNWYQWCTLELTLSPVRVPALSQLEVDLDLALALVLSRDQALEE